MIRIEPGEIHHRVSKDSREFTIHPYVHFYTQPIHRVVAARAYHFWSFHFMPFHNLCDKIDERYDNWIHRKTGRDNCKHATMGYRTSAPGEPMVEAGMFCVRMPWTARQDCRCYDLSRKGRKEVGTVFLDEVPKKSDRTVLGKPEKELPGVNDVDVMGLGWPDS